MVVTQRFFVTIFACLFFARNYADVVIWDLGGVLADQRHKMKHRVVKAVGIAPLAVNFLSFKIRHPFTDFGAHCQNDYLDTLRAIPYKARLKEICYSDDGVTPLPPLMIDWLAGKIYPENIKTLCHQWIQDTPQYFKEESTKNLSLTTIDNTFDPQCFINATELIEPSIRLLHACAMQRNPDGSRKNVCMICSNWDPYSFEILQKNFPQIFNFIDKDGIVVSGFEGTVKPNDAIFDRCVHIIEKYYPNQKGKPICFIDDQKINRTGAKRAFKKHGITIHCVHPRKARGLLRRVGTVST